MPDTMVQWHDRSFRVRGILAEDAVRVLDLYAELGEHRGVLRKIAAQSGVHAVSVSILLYRAGVRSPKRTSDLTSPRICRACGVEKPAEAYRINGHGSRYVRCQPCEMAATTKRVRACYHADPQKFIERASRWYYANRERVLARQRARYHRHQPYMRISTEVHVRRWRDAHPEEWRDLWERYGDPRAGEHIADRQVVPARAWMRSLDAPLYHDETATLGERLADPGLSPLDLLIQAEESESPPRWL